MEIRAKRKKEKTPKEIARIEKLKEALKPTQFGGIRGNTPYPIEVARKVRFLYSKFLDMTEAEIMAKIKDKDVPLRERLFLERWIKSATIRDDFELSNQLAGTPKQTFTGDINTREVGLSIDEIRNFVLENDKVNDNDNL